MIKYNFDDKNTHVRHNLGMLQEKEKFVLDGFWPLVR